VSRWQTELQSAAGAFTLHHRHVRIEPSHEDREVRDRPGIGKKERTDMKRSLYRRSLKLALDWAVQRNLWRGQAVYIRSLFDANKNIRDPRQQRVQRCYDMIIST
jgi:hypothetical protein